MKHFFLISQGWKKLFNYTVFVPKFISKGSICLFFCLFFCFSFCPFFFALSPQGKRLGSSAAQPASFLSVIFSSFCLLLASSFLSSCFLPSSLLPAFFLLSSFLPSCFLPSFLPFLGSTLIRFLGGARRETI